MSIPVDGVTIPARVQSLARGAALTPVWRNTIGGLTFRTDDARYLKWGPRNAETTMRAEAGRFRWASRWLAVPTVLEQGEEDTEEWMVTRALDARSAVAPEWIARPEAAVPAVGRALRLLHDTLPVADCPWDWSVSARIATATERGKTVPDHLRTPPPIDRLVVCHGDACCPNFLLDANGKPSAYVDLGALGLGDRWADLAPAMMSTVWNYGPGWEDTLLDAYGIQKDPERLAYYQALWDAT